MIKYKKIGLKEKEILIKKIKPFVSRYYIAENEFYNKISKLEKDMARTTGIDDIEFFISDGLAGVGNTSRTMKLIDISEVKNEKRRSFKDR